MEQSNGRVLSVGCGFPQNVLNQTKPNNSFLDHNLCEDPFFVFCWWEYLNPRIEAPGSGFQHFCGNNLFETIIVSYLYAIYHMKNNEKK
jgi:hypothetical protein